MADQNGQITQAGAPGTLLRTVAEANTQDPSKVQADAQVGAPIRNLTQQPLESNVPATTPRVLNVVPAQNPNPDFTGLHDLLSSAPVPPPHVAASLIRAMMTPPGQSRVVAAAQPVQTPAAPSLGGGAVAPSAPSAPAPSQPSQVSASTPSVANRSAAPATPASAPLQRVSFNPSASNAGLTYSSTPQQHSAPQLRQNVLGGNPFIGGTVGEGALTGLGGLIKGLTSLFGNGLRNAGPAAEEAGSILDELPGLF